MFPNAEVADFWMKDTILPLDMIFIRANGVVDPSRAINRHLALPIRSAQAS